MRCANCGAEMPSGADTCPDCGTRAAAVSMRPRVVAIAVVAVVVIALACAGYFIWRGFAFPNTPGGAVTRMMGGYADFDGQQILDNATHGKMTQAEMQQFVQAAGQAKSTSRGLPDLKDLKIIKTDLPSGSSTATVQFSASWLKDGAKGTYEQRMDQVTVIKQNGTWVVLLFQ